MVRMADVYPEQAKAGPVDWKTIKGLILSKIDLLAEYRSLGVRFVGGVNPATRKIQCHAMDREDANPSAFVSLESGYYHAHGDPPETLSFWDFALKFGTFGEWAEMVRHYAEVAGVEVPRFRKNNKGWVEEAHYPYHDKAGDLLYEVIRYRQPNGKKSFRQRQPDQKGGWIYTLDGVQRVLYRLPELHADTEPMVFLVEGEKDADALVELGLMATTSPQGAEAAGRKYWEGGLYAQDLAGRRVVIIPDNDLPGRSFARMVAGRLHGVAEWVRVVSLPGVLDKGDVSDWLDQGGTLGQLMQLVDDCPQFNPEEVPEEPDPERDATAADLIAADAGTRWLWPGWIPVSVLTLLTAEPSTGKTRLCLDLTKRIANGLPWPDGAELALPENLTNRVLWIAADNQHAELADAPAKFGFDPTKLVLNTTVGDIYGGTELQTEEQITALETRIRRVRPCLVVIDTITNTSDLKSQDTSDAKRQYKPLQEVAKRTGVAILCVTHLNVAGKTLGRRADEKTRVTIRLEKPNPDGEPNRRKLSVALSRLSVYPPAHGVTMHDAGNDYDLTPPEAPTEDSEHGDKKQSQSVKRAIEFLRERLGAGPERVSAIRNEAENMDPQIPARSLYRCKDQGFIEEFEMEDRKWWRLPSINGYHDEADGTY